MSIKFLRDNLPWIAPSAAIVFAASGYFDRGYRSDVVQEQPQVSQPVQAAAAPSATNTVVTQASQDAAQTTTLTQNAASEEQVVTRADSGIGASVTAPISSQNQPTFTDTQPTAVATLQGQQLAQQLARPTVQPQQPTQQVASFEQNPAAFFKDAQASLQAANSCKDDLRVLASQARVYFPSGGLTAEDAGLQQARLIGTVMQGCKGIGIVVTGHSDPSGDPAVNLRLSQKRAELVIQRLSASGIDTSGFVPQGLGDRQPSNVTGPRSSAYYDRRVEFSVVDLQATATFTNASVRSFTPSCVARLEAAVKTTKLYYAPRSIAASSADMDAVMDLAKQAQACPQARLRIVGQHTDESWAGEDVNTGILRAKALMSILVGQGIASNQVIIAAPSRSFGVEGKPELSRSRVDFDVIEEPA